MNEDVLVHHNPQGATRAVLGGPMNSWQHYDVGVARNVLSEVCRPRLGRGFGSRPHGSVFSAVALDNLGFMREGLVYDVGYNLAPLR